MKKTYGHNFLMMAVLLPLSSPALSNSRLAAIGKTMTETRDMFLRRSRGNHRKQLETIFTERELALEMFPRKVVEDLERGFENPERLLLREKSFVVGDPSLRYFVDVKTIFDVFFVNRTPHLTVFEKRALSRFVDKLGDRGWLMQFSVVMNPRNHVDGWEEPVFKIFSIPDYIRRFHERHRDDIGWDGTTLVVKDPSILEELYRVNKKWNQWTNAQIMQDDSLQAFARKRAELLKSVQEEIFWRKFDIDNPVMRNNLFESVLKEAGEYRDMDEMEHFLSKRLDFLQRGIDADKLGIELVNFVMEKSPEELRSRRIAIDAFFKLCGGFNVNRLSFKNADHDTLEIFMDQVLYHSKRYGRDYLLDVFHVMSNNISEKILVRIWEKIESLERVGTDVEKRFAAKLKDSMKQVIRNVYGASPLMEQYLQDELFESIIVAREHSRSFGEFSFSIMENLER